MAVANYDIVLLDRRLPDGDGLKLLRDLRAAESGVGVIVITARDAVQDRIEGLNCGADDYIVKPFAIDELVARMGAVLRRPGGALGLELRIADIALNTATREIRVGGAPLILPRRELSILELLMRAPGRVVTRDKLMEHLYGFEDDPNSNAIDANVSRLRRRLKEAGSGIGIRVVRGIGYMIGGTA
jgi:DNA-binding response OmpR family regulator